MKRHHSRLCHGVFTHQDGSIRLGPTLRFLAFQWAHFDDGVYVLIILLYNVLSQILRLAYLFVFARDLLLEVLLRLVLIGSRDLPFLTTFLLGKESWRRHLLRNRAHFRGGLVSLDVGRVGATLRAIQTFVGYIVLLSWRPRAASSAIWPSDFRALLTLVYAAFGFDGRWLRWSHVSFLLLAIDAIVLRGSPRCTARWTYCLPLIVIDNFQF